MTASLYRWPATARFGRIVPKTKFYERAAISASVRAKFVSDVQRITWAYKLADETVHLRANESVPEIQIFTIDAKDQDVSNDVLNAIDKAIPFPIIFELMRGTGEQAYARMVAAHKQLDSTIPRLSAYFTTTWQAADGPRIPLPPAVSLSDLYSELLKPILPIPTLPGEDLSGVTVRIDQALKLEREIAVLEKKLRNEPQLNRKVELRRRLRDRTRALTEVIEPSARKREEVLWTS